MSITLRYNLLFPIWLILFLIAATAQTKNSSALPPATAKTGAPGIVIAARVSDKKDRVVKNLTKDNFEVLLDRQPVPIISSEVEDSPLSVGIVFDASRPSRFFSPEAYREMVRDLQGYLIGFMDMSNSANEYFLLGFNKEPQLLVDWTSNPRTIVAALSVVEPKAVTAFYDACYLAIDKVQHGRYSKRVLIVLSDGQDNNSHYRLKQVREALKEADVLFYSINFSNSPTAYMAQETLNELSSASGGRAFYSGMSFDGGETLNAEITVVPPALEMIANELRYQYSLLVLPSFVPANLGSWHSVKVKATAADKGMKLRVLTREGFYLNKR